MKSNALQRGAGNVRRRGAACQTGDGAACLGLPVGRTQAGKGRHHHHAARVRHALRQGFNFGAALNGVNAVAQPLHHRTADKHAALHGELGLRADLRRAGGQQAVAGGLKLLTGVHQQKAAGAVGIFSHAGLEASLAKRGALLVSGHAADRDGMAQQVGADLAKVRAGRVDDGHHGGGNVQRLE